MNDEQMHGSRERDGQPALRNGDRIGGVRLDRTDVGVFDAVGVEIVDCE